MEEKIENYYTELGKKDSETVVVLLHGFTDNSDSMADLGARLSEKCRIILLDMTGHGKSPSRDTIDSKMLAQDVLNTLSSFPSFYAVGHSLGGEVAINMKDIAPEKVKGIVMLDSYPIERMNPNKEEDMAVKFYKALPEIFSTNPTKEYFAKQIKPIVVSF